VTGRGLGPEQGLAGQLVVLQAGQLGPLAGLVLGRGQEAGQVLGRADDRGQVEKVAIRPPAI
jgi:hypothetical protein